MPAAITPKLIRGLRNPRERRKSGLFFVEGIRIVGEAVQQGAAVEALVFSPALLASEFAYGLLEDGRQAGVPCLDLTPEAFQSLSSKDGPQGIGAVIRQRWEPLEGLRLGGELCWVALDAIQNPGNLGTIMRTCDAVGAGGVLLLGTSTDPYDPAAVRGSMGAIFSQRVVRTTFEDFARWTRRHGYTVVGTSSSAALDYQEAAYHPPCVILMGSERMGLSDAQVAACDLMVRIPMEGRSDSLNLAVATGVVLYEVYNQRRAGR
ncbi:MAG: RNA methyltransferase [Chloroflexota bacterium]